MKKHITKSKDQVTREYTLPFHEAAEKILDDVNDLDKANSPKSNVV